MGEATYNVFSFGLGGFFDGWHEFKIEKRDQGYVATLESMRDGDGDFTRPITDSMIDDFESFLRGIGVDNWFCHYNNWNVLDGTQWDMSYETTEYSGSNEYPEGFFALTQYLADNFGCACFACEDDEEDESDDEGFETWDGPYPNPLRHIAEYASLVCDPSYDAQKLKEGLSTAEELEEEQVEYKSVADQMRHDLDVLVGIETKFRNYMELVEQGGAPQESEAMRDCDVSQFDADTLVAMMIYIYREDRWCGYQEHFLDYVKDGTFKKWLDRLGELV